MASICPGVFFTPPAALPRGRHTLDRAAVRESQAQRLMIAATELLAHGGIGAASAKEICARAGVSLSAFYECFASKDACVFAAYDHFIAVLIERLESTGGEGIEWDEYVSQVVGAYIDTLGGDLVVARAFQVEMDSMGAVARHRRRDALTALGLFLRAKHADWDPMAPDRLPEAAYIAAVYGVRQLASDALDGPNPDFSTLKVDVTKWVSVMFAGPAEHG